jgi:hypothetical protein
MVPIRPDKNPFDAENTKRGSRFFLERQGRWIWGDQGDQGDQGTGVCPSAPRFRGGVSSSKLKLTQRSEAALGRVFSRRNCANPLGAAGSLWVVMEAGGPSRQCSPCSSWRTLCLSLLAFPSPSSPEIYGQLHSTLHYCVSLMLQLLHTTPPTTNHSVAAHFVFRLVSYSSAGQLVVTGDW